MMSYTSENLVKLLLIFTIAFPVSCESESIVLENKNVNQKMAQNKSHIRLGNKQKSCNDDMDCPPWTKCNNTKCECKANLKNHHTIKCDEATLELSVIRCHCVTYNNVTDELVEGNCIENCENGYDKSDYLPLPKDVSQPNQFMCEKRWNRTGRLCGRCLPGYSPLAYSYDMRCVKCPEGNKNILIYILVAFGPLTVFYFVLLLFKINAFSLYLHSYVAYSQMITTPFFARAITAYAENVSTYLKSTIIILADLYGIWNLDFFRGLYPDICLDVSTLTVLALDYAVAIYPLLLTVISYILIELYARNFRLVVILWIPFRYLFSRFRRNWESRTSVIDAFATFFLLSFTKMASTSVDLLTPVRVVNLKSNSVTWVPYNDATMEYFGKEHLPFAILALVCSTIFAILPILLLLIYQFRWFQRLLSCLHIHHPLLREVMESFQSCYTNGTQPGTKDRRWFSVAHYILRYSNIIVYSAILDSGYIVMGLVLIISLLVLTAIVQPYKNANHTKTDILFLGIIGVFYCFDEATNHPSLQAETENYVSTTLRIVVVIIPLLYIICTITNWILKWMKKRMRKVKIIVTRARAWRRGYENIDNDFEETLPDRIVNPENYQDENRPLDIVCSDGNCTRATLQPNITY
ncbi:uncharacterized protein LOC135343080 [Halichondria panicea]|uniref:uncharacterized protein LOC135343080 n=1 Tax=Halichondria panicea TaxID=6063 RepID=UPI00312B9D89